MAPDEQDPKKIVTRVKSIATKAINKAAIAKTEPGVNRSTATRESYKIKADALDEIAALIGGKRAAPKIPASRPKRVRAVRSQVGRGR